MPDTLDSTMDATFASMGGADATSGDAPGPSGSPSGTPVGSPGVSQEPWRTMPRSWRQELRDHYGRLDPAVMQEVHRREEDALRGITHYKGQSEQWTKLLQPYDQLIKQYGIQPQQAVGSLMAMHTILRYGSPEQKLQAAQYLAREYGLGQLLNGQNGQQPPPGVDPQVRNTLDSLTARMDGMALASASGEVEAFFKNPANKYAQKVGPQMLDLIESGRAGSLEEAYTIATASDPATFQEIVNAAVQARLTGGVRPPPNTRSSGRAAPSTPAGPKGTVEDTMRETLAQIQSR